MRFLYSIPPSWAAALWRWLSMISNLPPLASMSEQLLNYLLLGTLHWVCVTTWNPRVNKFNTVSWFNVGSCLNSTTLKMYQVALRAPRTGYIQEIGVFILALCLGLEIWLLLLRRARNILEPCRKDSPGPELGLAALTHHGPSPLWCCLPFTVPSGLTTNAFVYSATIYCDACYGG